MIEIEVTEAEQERIRQEYKRELYLAEREKEEYLKILKRRRLMEMREQIAFWKGVRQKSVGLITLLFGVASVYLLGDATAALLVVPLGIWLMITKEDLLS